ncbi:MAG: helix-turn-helix domain-containing protein [Blastocatellia bacterium]
MLTVKEVAERLGVGESTVRIWRLAGRFPGAVAEQTLRGVIWFIPESDLKGFVVRPRGRPPKPKPPAEQ